MPASWDSRWMSDARISMPSATMWSTSLMIGRSDALLAAMSTSSSAASSSWTSYCVIPSSSFSTVRSGRYTSVIRSRIPAGAARFIRTVRPVAKPMARSQSRSCGSAVAMSIVEFDTLSGRIRYFRARDSGTASLASDSTFARSAMGIRKRAASAARISSSVVRPLDTADSHRLSGPSSVSCERVGASIRACSVGSSQSSRMERSLTARGSLPVRS